MKSNHVARTLAWLIRNEQVDPAAIERAVTSAVTMRLGEAVTLADQQEALRRNFVYAQVARLERA